MFGVLHALGLIIEEVVVEAETVDENDTRRTIARPILINPFFTISPPFICLT
ncbi:hypothetical protein KDN24_00310 [Bacillus sp. Bva_UNVM-123]|uniref:hypothetical protein n=1 Tax=Bacillus sp. Bva_UNVM-123 TaxID=2829798 RepID=UPI00391F1B4B